MRLVIVNGYPASGKSTLSFKYAKEHDFALIIQDHFLFKMNPSSLKTKFPNKFHHVITLKNLLAIIENYMKAGKDILVEGALVSISPDDPMDISTFIKLAKKYTYQTKIITLVAEEKVRKRRQNKRGNTLKPQIDKKLVNASDNQNFDTANYRLDTSKLSIKKSLEELEKIIEG